MKIKNGELEQFIIFLETKPKYTRTASRMRRSLISILSEKYQIFKKEHMELLKQFTNIDDKGEFILIPIDVKNDKYKYDIRDENEFEKEYFELANEDVIIDQSESNRQMLLSIKESVLAYDPELQGIEATERDRWHDIVEEINYDEKGVQSHVGD